jgi:hypothetical protein
MNTLAVENRINLNTEHELRLQVTTITPNEYNRIFRLMLVLLYI